jgi:hypothetical protein
LFFVFVAVLSLDVTVSPPVGKIVMHLYGNFLPLVDIFLQLKGLELQRSGPSDYLVDDIDPHFYVHTGRTASTFRGPSTACYGVIQEGFDVVDGLKKANADSIFTIKQSHIYPVKKAK